MSPSKKLFIASVILATGYGVAVLLGTPVRPLLPEAFRAAPAATSAPAPAWVANSSPSATGNAPSSVRLLPDTQASNSGHAGVPSAGEAAANGNSAAPFARSTADPNSLLANRLRPRARLKLEPPRPLPEEARSTEFQAAANAQVAPNSVMFDSAATRSTNNAAPPDVWPAQYASAETPTATMPTPPPFPQFDGSAAQQAFSMTPLSPDRPPPWPAVALAEPPRTHVVVDGDSLAKLAGRYLDDPRRSDEIYELNRSALNDPELLPIGVELTIPAPGQVVDVTRGGQTQRPGNSPVHAATSHGLVPVRPIPMVPGAMPPRAQLMLPKPVE